MRCGTTTIVDIRRQKVKEQALCLTLQSPRWWSSRWCWWWWWHTIICQKKSFQYNLTSKRFLSSVSCCKTETVHLQHEVLMLIKIYNVGSTVVEKHMASIFRVQDRGSTCGYPPTRLHNAIIQRPKFFMTIVEVLSTCIDMITDGQVRNNGGPWIWFEKVMKWTAQRKSKTTKKMRFKMRFEFDCFLLFHLHKLHSTDNEYCEYEWPWTVWKLLPHIHTKKFRKT